VFGGYSSADAEDAALPTLIVARFDPTSRRLLVDVNDADVVIDDEAVDPSNTGYIVFGTDGSNYQALKVDSDGNIQADILSNPLTSGIFGQSKIAVTGTAVQLGSNTLTNGVIITALSTNTAAITIGGASVTNTINGTGNGYILEAGASVSIAATNTNVLYINGTSGDIISFIGC
jgi:hypothetical protein